LPLSFAIAASSRHQKWENDAMPESDLHDYARQLWDLHGPKAIAEAAQKASDFEKKGENEQAQNWRRIEAMLLQMRGPHQS